MFENIYGMSCVENHVLAQLKLRGENIASLYGKSYIDISSLFYRIINNGEKPEYFNAFPRIQDVLKQTGAITLNLIPICSLLNDINKNENDTVKFLVKAEPDFVKDKLHARGFRSDHYVLTKKTNRGFILFNDIPDVKMHIESSELLNICVDNYFKLQFNRVLSKEDYSMFSQRDTIAESTPYIISASHFDGVDQLSMKIRNFFWIYKIIVYRTTEYFFCQEEAERIKDVRSKADNMLACAEYLNLRGCRDVSKFLELFKVAQEMDTYIKSL